MGPRLVKLCEIFCNYILRKNYPLVPGQKLINVSAASDGTVWGVDRNRNIFRWSGTGWLVFLLSYNSYERNLAD
jgi:hypothetical protein